jgi:hypothetical protein
MPHRFLCIVILLALFDTSTAIARCARFNGSTMDIPGVAKAKWRTDYPSSYETAPASWLAIDFTTHPREYMSKVLETVKPHFRRQDRKLVGSGNEDWWISLWLDYTTYGREPLMGLTKERGPDPGDLSAINTEGSQVWAVGFYNVPGASVLGKVFADPCNPAMPHSVSFPLGSVSVKFLFTDAPTDEVAYLQGAPEYDALIDAAGSGSSSRLVSERQTRTVRLLQLDIAVKDDDAIGTGWVFGTFGWIGPTKGDGLYDNLVPVSLQWGNDPGIYASSLLESWINSDLRGVLYGWQKRPTLGFNGRANGPADNIRSSCLSCHAAARIPRSSKGLLGFRFDMDNDITNPDKVREHVGVWFTNLASGTVFDPQEPAVSALDYSLQLEAGTFRLCRACRNGRLTGETPKICRMAKLYDEPLCGTEEPAISEEFRRLDEAPPPRQ